MRFSQSVPAHKHIPVCLGFLVDWFLLLFVCCCYCFLLFLFFVLLLLFVVFVCVVFFFCVCVCVFFVFFCCCCCCFVCVFFCVFWWGGCFVFCCFLCCHCFCFFCMFLFLFYQYPPKWRLVVKLLVPRVTAAGSGHCCVHHTTSLQCLFIPSHICGVRVCLCVFTSNLPPALLAERPGSFTCYCGNTGMQLIPK